MIQTIIQDIETNDVYDFFEDIASAAKLRLPEKYSQYDFTMVIDWFLDAVHKGTEKRHIRTLKSTYFAVHINSSIFRLLKVMPLHPAPFQNSSRLIFKIQMLTEKCK